MTPFFGSVLISTGDAARMTGYSPDYLTRLARSGIVSGRKFGDTWFLSRYALEEHLTAKRAQFGFAFVDARTETLSDHMRATQPPWLNGLAQTPLHEQLFALSVAAIVLFAGAAAAHTTLLPQVESRTVVAFTTAVQNVRLAIQGSGQSSPVQLFPAQHAPYVAAAAAASETMQHDLVAGATAQSESFSPDLRAAADHAALQNEEQGIRLLAALSSAWPALIAHLDSPAHITASAAAVYLGAGNALYGTAQAVPGYYLAAVQWAGSKVYGVAVQTRDLAASIPRLVTASLTAVGRATQSASSAAIQADTRLAYGIAAAAPTVARMVTAGVVVMGQRLAQFAAATPYRARDAYLSAVAVPAQVGPALAQDAFALEYGAASRFVSAVQSITSHYEAGVQTTAVALNVSVSAISSATLQTAQNIQVAAVQFAQFSRTAVQRGATASATALGAFSSALSGRP